MGVIYPRLAFVCVEIFVNFCFLAHDFGSRYARKPLKGSNDADHNLFSKQNLIQNIFHWVGAQGQVKLAPKSQKHTLIVTSSPENPKPKTKPFFSFSTARLAEYVDALYSPLAQSAGVLWSCKNLKSRIEKVARAQWRTQKISRRGASFVTIM